MTSLVSQSGYGLMNGPIDRQHAIFLGIHWGWTDVGRSPDAGLDLPFDETLAAKVTATLMRVGGVLVAGSGRDLVCSLGSAQYAIEAVSEINRQCDRESVGRHIVLRMGILIEDAPPDSPTESAQAISRASRLAHLASPGQTLIRAVGAAIPESLRRRLTPADTSEWDELPDLSESSLFLVNWRDQVATRLVKTLTPDMRVTRVSRLRLRWRNQQLVLSASSGEVSLGRGAEMDISIDSEFASRDHARIRCQGATFILADVSTNGTYVNLDDSVVFIHDDEIILRGQGWISLGKHASQASGKVLYFFSELSAS